MFKQAILAATAAGMIAAGGLAITTTAASAAPYQGNNWNGPYPHHQQVCHPVFKQVKWWDRFGRPHWKQVIVARNCDFRSFYPHPHQDPHPAPHPVW
ncbi:MAG TPA: hypothetical protein VII91_03200 [Bauldia sp.]